MRLPSWLRPARSAHRPGAPAPRPAPLRVERLEGRTVPATFTVRTLADAGLGSLRAAIAAANDTPGADVIRFAPAARGTVTLTSGELAITDDVRIDGPGAGRVAVSGNDTSRVFRIDAGAVVAIDGLTITRGNALLRGGGIRNDGTLTLSRAVVSDNEVVGVAGFGPPVDAFGGGVFNAGTLTVRDTLFVGNRATGGDGIPATATTPGLPAGAALGGAIFSIGTAAVPATAAVTRSTFLDNQAVGGTAGVGATSRANGLGGAVMNDAGTFTVSDSLFRGNRAVGGASVQLGGGGASGGAIAQSALSGDSTFTVRRSTFTGNQAVGGAGGAGGPSQFGRGGAIANLKAPFGTPPSTLRAVMRVIDSTVVGNEAVGGAGVIAGNGLGGGLANDNGGTMEVARTLVALNRAAGGVSVGGASGNGLGGGVYNGQAISPAFGSTALSLNTGVVAFNRAEGGAATAGGTAGSGLGGGVYVSPGGIADAFGTSVFANDASTSDDDVFGDLGVI
ncbi:MAG: hypothetical protein C0501_14560 [Isosphaera sp.]|nr:hypothetical protein [Isosphaera sp.]